MYRDTPWRGLSLFDETVQIWQRHVMRLFSLVQRLLFALCAFVSLTGALHGQNSPRQYTVDFSKTDNLKAVFDAGLRPWRLLGLENSVCMLGKENLKIVMSGNANFTLKANMVSMEVLEGNHLYSVDLNTAPMTIDAAADVARDVCKGLNIDSKGLDVFVAGIGGPARGVPAWGGHAKINGVFIQVRFETLPSFTRNLAQVAITIRWPVPSPVLSAEHPIRPPPGYENVSMDPTKDNPSTPPSSNPSAQKAQTSADAATLPQK
jgi:hypothetical protein